MLKFRVVIGTNPEVIKCAIPIIEMRKDERIDPIIISTGQHDEMLHSTLSVFGIKADVKLKVMRERQTISNVTHRILDGLSKVPMIQKIDAIIVHRNTASSVAGALFGFQNRIFVIHIEAGLRIGVSLSTCSESLLKNIVNADNLRMRKTYPSDIIREQFEQIRPLLEQACKRTYPAKVSFTRCFVASCICWKTGANGAFHRANCQT